MGHVVNFIKMLIRYSFSGIYFQVCRLVFLSRFGGRQNVVFARNPYVEYRQKKNANNQIGQQAADDDDGEGSCESDPIAREKDAGSRPSVATSMVIMMGRRRRTAIHIRMLAERKTQ
jgi:hypothetical protein